MFAELVHRIAEASKQFLSTQTGVITESVPIDQLSCSLLFEHANLRERHAVQSSGNSRTRKLSRIPNIQRVRVQASASE